MRDPDQVGQYSTAKGILSNPTQNTLGYSPAPQASFPIAAKAGTAPASAVKGPVKKPATYAPARAVAPHASNPAPSVGNTSTGVIAPVTQPAAPVAPSIDEWLAGDSTFKTQNDALSKAWADYQNNQKLSTDQYKQSYATNVDALGKQKTLDEAALNDDYASRGLMNSGLYSKGYTDFLNGYADKQKALDTGQSDFLANLASQGQNFQSDQQIQADKAKQDAINRRAAQYGV